jgi:hypothetical protein
MQKCKFAFCLSFEPSANYISWIGVFWEWGVKFSEKFYVQENELRGWKSNPLLVSDLALLMYGF